MMTVKMKVGRMVLLLALGGGSSHGVTNYTETFSVDAANWRITDSVTPMTWVADGGPAGVGDAYASHTNVNFIGLVDGASRLAVRGHGSFPSSGGAFVGNWLDAGVYAFSIDVRHHLGVPAKVSLRLAAPANSPGASIDPGVSLPSGEWGTLVVPIDSGNSGFISFGAGNFSNTFSSIGNIQVNLHAPPGFGGAAGPFILDIDNPAIHLGGAGASGETIDEPTYDRWMYPFNASSPLGNRPAASTFAAFDPDFDNRDAQVYFGFVLTNAIPAGLGPEAYQILACRFRATMSDGVTEYDPTQDAWTSYLSPTQTLYTADTDAGRPMELFGAGWRNGWTPGTFGENGPFAPGFGVFRDVRNVFAVGVHNAALVDVSNSVDPDGTGLNGFDPVPFAIGQAPVPPGDLIPLPTTFTFDVDTSHPLIQGYLQAALDDGVLGLVLATLHPAAFMGPAVFPVWDQKENIVGEPATLEIVYRLVSDIDLGFDGDIQVVRWVAGSAPVVVEATHDLVEPQWRPQTMMARHDGHDRTAEISSTQTVHILRLKYP
ncbi:MAG TPA: hypothetical protein PKE55_14140 [Kiritimatiellia bacterium]|nr:hypothetical protein [Kiritimatiellia bacterium]